MWFKNLSLFRFTEPVNADPTLLSEALAQAAFRPVLQHEARSLGWSPPLPGGEQLHHPVQGALLVKLRTEDKLLPPAVVKEALAERIELLEARENRRIRRREKEQLRDEITQELLPRAFSRSRWDSAYLDPRGGWLVVDSASARVVDTLTGLLRESLGSLPIAPLRTASAPAAILTDWLRDNPPAELELGEECELREGDEGGLVRLRGLDLQAEEVVKHLEAGMQVTRLALTFRDRLGFILGEDLVIRKLRFLDVVREALDDVHSDDAAQLMDAEATLMVGELRELLAALPGWFGGEAAAPGTARIPTDNGAPPWDTAELGS